MLLTAFLAIVFCAAMAMMLLSAVAFIQENKYGILAAGFRTGQEFQIEYLQSVS